MPPHGEYLLTGKPFEKSGGMRRIGGHTGETKPTEHAEQDSRGHAASFRALAAAEVNERRDIRANSRRY